MERLRKLSLMLYRMNKKVERTVKEKKSFSFPFLPVLSPTAAVFFAYQLPYYFMLHLDPCSSKEQWAPHVNCDSLPEKHRVLAFFAYCKFFSSPPFPMSHCWEMTDR